MACYCKRCYICSTAMSWDQGCGEFSASLNIGHNAIYLVNRHVFINVACPNLNCLYTKTYFKLSLQTVRGEIPWSMLTHVLQVIFVCRYNVSYCDLFLNFSILYVFTNINPSQNPVFEEFVCFSSPVSELIF